MFFLTGSARFVSVVMRVRIVFVVLVLGLDFELLQLIA